jgi:hypothetical protein
MPKLGYKQTEEHKRKVSLALKNKPKSIEHNIKNSETNRMITLNRIFQNNGINPGLKGVVQGNFFSHKNKCDIHYDSSYEFLAYGILELLSEVKYFSRCKFSIDYRLYI